MLELFNLATDTSFIAVLIKICIFIGGLFIFSVQVQEILRPVDGLTRLRWQILAAVTISIIAGIPALTYHLISIAGGDTGELSRIATVTTNVSQLSIMILLVMIFTYVRRDK